MKKLFTLIAALGIIAGTSMQAQEFPSDPGELKVDLIMFAIDEEYGDTIQGFAPEGAGTYDAGYSLTVTAREIPGYTFLRWSDEVEDQSRQLTLNESLELNAIYSHDLYQITFLDANGEEYNTTDYRYGAVIVLPQVPPTKESQPEQGLNFVFRDWDPTIPEGATVVGNQTYAPLFDTIISVYAVRFLDWNDTVLYEDSLQHGAVPEYKGEEPKREMDEEGNIYTFAGWGVEQFVGITGDREFFAQYTSTKQMYTITIIYGAVEPETHSIAHGADTILNPPVRTEEHFIRWSDGNTDNPRTVVVTSDTTFIAEYGASFVDVEVAANQWTFLTLPIHPEYNRWTSEQFAYPGLTDVAWGTYNGAVRAQAKSGWEGITDPDFAAAQGYILWSSTAGTFRLNVYPENLQNETASVQLNAYEAEHAENANWNFIGNPLNAELSGSNVVVSGAGEQPTATVWNGIGYDNILFSSADLKLQPLQAFFVQTAGEGSISFQVANQPAPARARAIEDNIRIDINATAGGYTDKSRVIFRSNSKLEYEAGRDASKFITSTAPIQMYFLDINNVKCAQMVRPEGDDNIRLGYTLLNAGDITIDMPIYAEDYVLYDRLTGNTYELSEPCTIYSEKGKFESRLELRPVRKVVTAIDNTNAAAVSTTKLIINGQLYLLRDGQMYTIQGLQLR